MTNTIRKELSQTQISERQDYARLYERMWCVALNVHRNHKSIRSFVTERIQLALDFQVTNSEHVIY